MVGLAMKVPVQAHTLSGSLCTLHALIIFSCGWLTAISQMCKDLCKDSPLVCLLLQVLPSTAHSPSAPRMHATCSGGPGL